MSDRMDLAHWMARALQLADRAAAEGEVPVGALVRRGEQTLGEGWNRSLRLQDPTAHAEVLALRRAAALTGNYRLAGSMLITTLEPCPMCFGALLEARVRVLVFGVADPRRGAVSVWNSGALRRYPAGPLAVIEGVEEAACRLRLKRYFGARR